MRSGASSVGERGSGLAMSAPILGDAPRPEVPWFAGGFPPLILMSIAPFPFVMPEPLPPLPPAKPPGLPDAPGCLPSGEMDKRAARFPRGGTTGAGGPGVAESAIKVAGLPSPVLACATPISGAGLAFPVCSCGATRGAALAFNSSFGRAGALGETGMAISAGFCSSAGTSGRGDTVTAARRRSRGFNLASDCSLICNRGRAGPGRG